MEMEIGKNPMKLKLSPKVLTTSCVAENKPTVDGAGSAALKEQS
jgi:hypothetical protein